MPLRCRICGKELREWEDPVVVLLCRECWEKIKGRKNEEKIQKKE